MTTTLLGEKIEFPICIAPTAMQKMANPAGEVATAKGINEFFLVIDYNGMHLKGINKNA